MSETKEITLFDKIQDPVQAIEKLGEWISKSGLFGCEKVEQGMVLAMASLSEKRPITDICRRYHIVKGKLSMKAEAMLAEFNQRGGRHKWIKSDDKEAIISLTFGDFKDFPVRYAITDAERAGLCGKDGAKLPGQSGIGSWQKQPDAMLRARVTSEGIRMVCPEIVAGVYTPEEVDDMRLTLPPATTASVSFLSSPAIPVEAIPETETPKAEAAIPQELALIDKLKQALEPMEDAVNEYIRDQKWVAIEQTFRDLPAEKATAILERLPIFKMNVRRFASQYNLNKSKEMKNK